MSSREDRKRKRKEREKKDEQSRRLERQRKEIQALDRVEGIFARLGVLLNCGVTRESAHQVTRAIELALNKNLNEEAISKQLGLSEEIVAELLDLAGRLPQGVVSYMAQYPMEMSNPRVRKEVLRGLKERCRKS